MPVVLGELSSGVAAAVGPIAEDNSLPFIMTVPTGPNLTEQGQSYVFRVNANNQQLNVALADFLAKQGWSPVGFIAWNNDAGRGGVNGMKQLLPAAKDGYVGYFNVGEVDFSSHVSNLRANKAQAVMLLMDEEPGSLAIKQIRDAGLNASDRHPGDGLGPLPEAPRCAEARRHDPVQRLPARTPTSRGSRLSVTRYKAKFGEEAHGFAAQSYDGLKVALAAMEQAGTVTDGKAIRDGAREDRMQGVIGTIKFDAQGAGAVRRSMSPSGAPTANAGSCIRMRSRRAAAPADPPCWRRSPSRS